MGRLQTSARYAATKGRNIVVAEVVGHDHHNIGESFSRRLTRGSRALLPDDVAGWAYLGRRQGGAHLDRRQDRGARVQVSPPGPHCQYRRH